MVLGDCIAEIKILIVTIESDTIYIGVLIGSDEELAMNRHLTILNIAYMYIKYGNFFN